MIYKINSLLERKEKIQAVFLFAGIVLRGLIEVAGVVSIMPFIAVAANPEIINTNNYLFSFYTYFNFQSPKTFLVVLGLLVFSIIILNNTLSALTEWFLVRFTWLRGHEIARRLLGKYLSQPYSFFIKENSASLGANILNEVSFFLKGVLRPFMDMVAKIIVSLFLFILLTAVDPLLALIMGLVLGSSYTAIFLTVRKKLAAVGIERASANQKQFLYISEAFNGIKDIKVRNCEQFFLESFSRYSYRVNLNQAINQIVSQIPRYALEVIAFGGILLITLYFVITEKTQSTVIPLMALYAFAGYRLMPALQGVFAGLTTIRFNLSVLDKLVTDLALDKYPHQEIADWRRKVLPMGLHQAIELREVEFTYPGAETATLNRLNLTIKARTTVGFAGSTGAGKTTLIDIILGLFSPDKGELLVDGNRIDRTNIREWLGSVGYVPQQIFLSDQSVRCNIAFGLPADEIDTAAVERAARIAQLHQFIVSELPEGYDTPIGERGVRLSGGQRQRLGIARALYRDPDVLILDEATSSLDSTTEAEVMESIRGLARRKTIVMIAHRLSTLVDCDVIHFMDRGRVSHSGNYRQLLRECPEFLEMNRDRH